MTSCKANEAINTEEKLNELKRRIELALTQIDDAYEHVTHAFAKGEALDPRIPDYTGHRDTFYRFVYECFHDKPLKDVTIPFFIQIWHELQLIQKDENILIYDLDIVAAVLSDAFINIGDKGAALRWRLALVASKALCYEESPARVNSRILQRRGVPFEAISQLASIALNNRHGVASAANWQAPEAFPEHSVTKFSGR